MQEKSLMKKHELLDNWEFELDEVLYGTGIYKPIVFEELKKFITKLLEKKEEQDYIVFALNPRYD